MPLIIKHDFPLGRFHATRWKQNPFEDPYGEWPPSPWRLLRALASRWFQYVRETGDNDELRRNELLGELASSLPAFALPRATQRGLAIKQYHPTGVEWTDKSKAAAGYKTPQSTLVEDHYRALPSDEAVYWIWDSLDLDTSKAQLLDHLLERTLYFGRSESFCRLRRVDLLPQGTRPNCHLKENGNEAMSPVLAPIPGDKLQIQTLLASTDDKEHLRGRAVPTGTTWYYAQLAPRPTRVTSPVLLRRYPEGLNWMQFAVGGRVLPEPRRWIKITERFRSNVVRHLTRIIDPQSEGRYNRLTADQRERLALICGKDGQGSPLRGHQHAFFLLWPDEQREPTRLIVWRSSPFRQEEIDALLAASELPIAWENATPEWKLRVVPLPFESPTPEGLLKASCEWHSATPFVIPAERRRFRRNGRARSGESPDRILTKLLRDAGLPEPVNVSLLDDRGGPNWVDLHETRERRLSRVHLRTPWVRPGFNLCVEFPIPVRGPLMLGDSCHFGLGLFASS